MYTKSQPQTHTHIYSHVCVYKITAPDTPGRAKKVEEDTEHKKLLLSGGQTRIHPSRECAATQWTTECVYVFVCEGEAGRAVFGCAMCTNLPP